MRHKSKIFFLTFLIFTALPTNIGTAQTVTHWQRIPQHGRPQMIRHPLGRSDQGGELFRLRYETVPVTTMMRRIRLGFSELFPETLPDEGIVDISRSTQLLEALEQESENALEQGYDELNFNPGTDYSIFDPDRPEQKNATNSNELPEQPELMLATVSVTLGAR